MLLQIKFSSFKDLMKIIDGLVDNVSSEELLDFIDNLDNNEITNRISNPKKSNRLNFLELILQRHTSDDLGLIKKILALIGNEYYNYLMNFIINKDSFINLHILEFLVYIDSKRVRKFLDKGKYRFKFDFSGDVRWDFHLLLNILLLCYSPSELMIFLEKRHKTDLFNRILPEMSWFKFLKMSSYLEDVRSEFYHENLKNLGLFIMDIMLNELSDEYDENKEEINLRVVRALDWVGGEAEEKLNALSNQYNIEKYRDILY